MLSGRRTPILSGPGGIKEVLRLALPLIISNSFWSLQITIDRMMLSQHSSDNVGAALTGIVLFWSPFTLLFGTALYSITFVAQYLGANRKDRIGPVVWQSLWFSIVSGMGFLLLIPVGDFIINHFGTDPQLQVLETTYFRCLCFAALPMLIIHSATSFYLGQGRNWIVMLVNAVGMLTNAGLDYLWIFGNWGFAEGGIAGAGWATVTGSWAAAIFALFLLFRPKHQAQFHLWSGWRLDPQLFKRLLRFGVPSGLQLTAEVLALNVVIFLIRYIGPVEMSATGIAFSLNVLAFLPPMGIAQAVSVLVGQRLGENRPDLAVRSTYSGFLLTWSIMTAIGLTFVLLPDYYLMMYQSTADDANWPAVAALTPILLRFVAVYCLFDSINLVFSHALKGAGDTRFVSVVTLLLAWPIMAIPTALTYQYSWGLYVAWTSITIYVFSLAVIFYWRFRQGKWKTMRVIEQDAEADVQKTNINHEEVASPAVRPQALPEGCNLSDISEGAKPSCPS